MRIKSIMIDGFGHFHEASLEGLPEELVLISGDNEAGKSTLLGFIRAIMFGFPDRRSNENNYEPLVGGRHGGRITVLTEKQGEIIIERMAGTKGGPVNLLFTGDGSSGGEEELRHLLGGFNKFIYRNIYAFSLEELQTFDSLNADDVRGALYGAGAGTSLMSIPESMKKLDKSLENLFKNKGSKPLINTKLAEIEEVQKKIRNASNGIRNYEELTLNQQEIRTKIEQLQQERDAFQTNHNRIENYIKLWDQWIILQDAEAKLNALPEIITEFPNEGLIRLDSINKDLEALIKSRKKASKNQVDLENQLKNLIVNELLISHEPEILERRENLPIYTTSLKELSTDRQSLEQIKRDIRRELDNLGSDWTEERVYSIDRSLFTQDAIRQHNAEHRAAQSEWEKAEDALKQVREEYESALWEEEITEKELEKFQDMKARVDKNILSSIQNGRNQFASIVSDLPVRKKELKDASESLEKDIREIDPNWNVSMIESFDCSVPAQEKIQSFEQELITAENKVNETENRLEFEVSNLSNIQKELKIIKEKFHAIPEPFLKTKNNFVSRKNDIKSLRDKLNKKELLIESISHHQERLTDKQNILQKIQDETPNPLPGLFKWVSIAMLLIGLIAFGIVSVLLNRLLESIIIGGIFAILGVGFFIINKIVEKHISKNKLADQTNEKEKKELEKVREKLDNFRKQLAEAESQIEKLKNIIGVSANFEIRDLDKLENQTEIDLNHFNEITRLKEESNRIREREDQGTEIIEKLSGNLMSQKEAFQLTGDNWERQIDHLSLKRGTKPRTVNLIFTKVDGIKTKINNMKRLEERIRQMEVARDEYRAWLDQIPELSGKVPTDLNELLSLVDRFLEQTVNLEKRRQDRDLVRRTLEEKQKNRKVMEEKVSKAKKRIKKATDWQSRTSDVWQKWLSQNRLDQDISPETALSALETINKCIQFIDTKSELEELINQKENQIKRYLDSSSELFTKIEKSKPVPDSLVTEIKLLTQELDESKIALETKKNLQVQLKGISDEIDSLKQEIEVQKAEIQKLMKEGGSEDEETFKIKGELFEKRQGLLVEMENAAKNMKIISGESNLGTLKEILAKCTREKLENENRGLQQNLREVREELETKRQELAEIKNKLENLSSSDDISRLRAEEEKLKEEIRMDAKVWGTHAIARYLLKRASERFEKEHQPKVIKEASSFFNTFTGGKYRNIIAPLGKQSIEVMTVQDKQKKPKELSRATAEQLFLALRFGYITNYAKNNEVLPIIMDDILVNFDPTRSRQASKAILGLAESHQVLFFTCHPETISIFKEQKENVPVYRIEDGKFSLFE